MSILDIQDTDETVAAIQFGRYDWNIFFVCKRQRAWWSNFWFRQFRNNYLQSGGHDPSVIARYADIENRLRAYENYPWTTDYPEPLKSNRCLFFL